MRVKTLIIFKKITWFEKHAGKHLICELMIDMLYFFVQQFLAVILNRGKLKNDVLLSEGVKVNKRLKFKKKSLDHEKVSHAMIRLD